eukprot:5093872-Amphidinium_carterae.1
MCVRACLQAVTAPLGLVLTLGRGMCFVPEQLEERVHDVEKVFKAWSDATTETEAFLRRVCC